MPPLLVSASIDIAAESERVFDAAAALDPVRHIRPSGVLPGVAGCDDAQGGWSAIGQLRRLTLTDGVRLTETLTAFEPPRFYAYDVEGFAGLFGALISGADASWRIEPARGGLTRVEWRYRFTPRGAIEGAMLRMLVRALWPGYMRRALESLKRSLETGS